MSPDIKHVAKIDMIVQAIEEKKKRTKEDDVDTVWIVKAKQEATDGIALKIKYKDRESWGKAGWFVGKRFEIDININQSTLQEFDAEGPIATDEPVPADN